MGEGALGMTPLVEVVTTFNPEGYELYGKRFIETFKKNWHGNILLSIYAEGMQQRGLNEGERIRWRSYEYHCPKGVAFKKQEFPPAPDVKENVYRFDAKRFSHKVFALADAMRRSRADYLILMDADIVTFGYIYPEWFDEWMHPEAHVACLQRGWYHHTESAFVLHRLGPKVRDLIETYEECYTSGHVFALEHGWCDSSVCDYVRNRFTKERRLLVHNISPRKPEDGLSVFPESILGTKMVHLKGPGKFNGDHEIQRAGHRNRQLARQDGPHQPHP